MTSFIIAASAGDSITEAVAKIAEYLLYPVLITAMLALGVVVWEVGRLLSETWKRSQRTKVPFDQVARQAQAQAQAGDSAGAQATLKAYSYGSALQKAAVGTVFAQTALDAQRAVIDYDLYVSKRLDRVRLLVRAGPALGLMGTLIPLSPALAALGSGKPDVLADELQTAFAITVIGVLIGLVAFTVALVRERYYTRDLTDLEFLRELRGDAVFAGPATVAQPSAATPAHKAPTDQPEAASAAVADQAAAAAAQTVVSPAATQAAAPVPAAPAPVAPAPAVPGAPTVPGVAAPPAFPPPAAESSKKKFGLRKKTPKVADAPGFPPPPPAPTIPPAGPTGPSDGKSDAGKGEDK